MNNYRRGWAGVALRVNLDTKQIVKQPLSKDLLNSFVGGRGLTMKFLYDEVKPGTDPLGPDNKVFFAGGACGGTALPGTQRFNVSAKSPLSGFLGDSNCGGDFGAELKLAGYDIIIIEGKSPAPVYLWIDDENVD